MKKTTKQILLGLTTLACMITAKVQADTRESVRIVGIIGTDMLVRFDRNVLVAEIDSSIGTSGGEDYFMGTLEMSLFNNYTSTTKTLEASSAERDTATNNFRLLKNKDPNLFVMLKLTTDTDASGNKVSQPIVFTDGTTLRSYVGGTDPVIEDEVHIITVYATDNLGNSIEDGAYETTIQFAWNAF